MLVENIGATDNFFNVTTVATYLNMIAQVSVQKRLTLIPNKLAKTEQFGPRTGAGVLDESQIANVGYSVATMAARSVVPSNGSVGERLRHVLASVASTG